MRNHYSLSVNFGAQVLGIPLNVAVGMQGSGRHGPHVGVAVSTPAAAVYPQVPNTYHPNNAVYYPGQPHQAQPVHAQPAARVSNGRGAGAAYGSGYHQEFDPERGRFVTRRHHLPPGTPIPDISGQFRQYADGHYERRDIPHHVYQQARYAPQAVVHGGGHHHGGHIHAQINVLPAAVQPSYYHANPGQNRYYEQIDKNPGAQFGGGALNRSPHSIPAEQGVVVSAPSSNMGGMGTLGPVRAPAVLPTPASSGASEAPATFAQQQQQRQGPQGLNNMA